VPNALAAETSPYLRQHAENPVDWLPWGPEALRRARELDRPLLVSIGYSACHWCHVMERESFEDQRTAQVMNDSFVCVKVDREERPDVDALYMEAVQSMTGQGGWPLNVFLTPEQVPFYGGTYFPPEPRQGMPSWTQVLQAIASSWSENATEIRAGGERVREQLTGAARLSPSQQPLQESALEYAVEGLRGAFDPAHGGFGRAPKFPHASAIEFLLLRGERELALAALAGMAAGGIHDVVGGGFARYSVDASWTVPHFEKMLYDNALLARAYLHSWQAGGGEEMLAVCRDTLDWALAEMRGPEGAFYAALDADSEGVEGRYYVWRTAELREVLGADADVAIAWLGATDAGNFTEPHHPEPGLNVLQSGGPAPAPELRESIRRRLLERRSQRVRPGLDDKRITSWNALMVSALADAGAALGEPAYTEAAVACAEFLLERMRDDEGRLLRTFSQGRAGIPAYLEDHAFLLEALIVLFETTCEERWWTHAIALAEETIERFADPERGDFYSTAADGEPLLARRKEIEDSPIPAGGSSAALALQRLGQLTGEERYERHADAVLRLLYEIAPRHPLAFSHILQALHWQFAPARPIACAVPGAGSTGSTGSGPAPSS
jgi:uncharacterized protein YyaL (SSP411 family)